MRIGVDLDGVGYDFTSDARDVCATHLGVAPESLAPITHWDFYGPWGLDGDTFWKVIYAGVADGLVWNHRPPVDGFVETLTELRDDGHTVHICTSRGGAEEATFGWLKRFAVPSDSITISKDKTVVDVDAFIEDYEFNYLALTEIGVSCALLDQPWNRHVDAFDDRVIDWGDFLAYIDGLAEVLP